MTVKQHAKFSTRCRSISNILLDKSGVSIMHLIEGPQKDNYEGAVDSVWRFFRKWKFLDAGGHRRDQYRSEKFLGQQNLW